MTARARIFWTDSLGRAGRTCGCSVNMEAAGPGEHCVTDYAPWLQEMTAEAECMAHTAPSVIARCVRGSSGWVERV